MKVSINKDACITCGSCAAICENVFEIGDEGIAEVKVEEVAENDVEAAKEAIDCCPTGAISGE